MARTKAVGPIAVHEPLQQEDQQQGLEDKAMETMWRSANLQSSRTVLTTGRKGPKTPIPSWKMYENPFYEGILAAVQNGAAAKRDVTVSARKLAATLWSLQQEAPQPLSSSMAMPESNPQSNETVTSTQLLLLSPPSPSLSDCSLISAKQSSTELAAAKTTDSNGKNVQANRQVAALRSHVQRLLERRVENKDMQINSLNNQHTIGIEAQRQDLASSNTLSEHKHADLASSNTLSEHKHAAVGTSLAAALLVELDYARACAQELEAQQKIAWREIEILQKKTAEERANWRNKEQEKIRSAIQAAKEEAEEERKSKRRLELANKKLVNELADSIATLSKVSKDLERERKARELMEDVCDELAREIAEDKAEVEELRRDSAMVREEVEEERRMLQVAEALREERVQMKLAEAHYELEERAAVLDNMMVELEDFLAYRRYEAGDDANDQQTIRKAESLCIAVEALQLDKTSFLSGYEDDGPSRVTICTQPDSFSVDLSKNYEDDVSQFNEDETFLKQQKSRPKSSKHSGRTKLVESSKRNRLRGKISKRGSMKDQRSEWEGANASESTGNAADVHVFENEYAKLNLDNFVSVSDSEDGDVNANVHPVSNEIEIITEQSTSQFTIILDPQTDKLNTDDVWVFNALASEEHDSNIEEFAPNQQGREPKSPSSHVHTSQPFTSSVSQQVNPSSGTTIHEVSCTSMDSRNSQITRGIKGAIEWSKNVRTRQEKQQGRRSGKTIR